MKATPERIADAFAPIEHSILQLISEAKPSSDTCERIHAATVIYRTYIRNLINGDEY